VQLSPISLDTNALPSAVPAPPSSGAGAAGFAEQLQLVAAMAPPDAPAPPAIPGAANSLPLNTSDAGKAGSLTLAQASPLAAFTAIAPPAPLAFHSTAESHFGGVVFSSLLKDAAPQAPASAAPAPAGNPAVDPDTAEAAPVASTPATDAKPHGNVTVLPQNAAPALAAVPPQKIAVATPVPPAQVRPEQGHKAHSEKADPANTDTDNSQPQSTTTAPLQQAAAPAQLPVNMILPVTPHFARPLTPLGNRIPADTPGRPQTPVAAAAPDTDSDPKPAALSAETIAPMIATADQLAFATKVQLAKPQTVSLRVASSSSLNPNEAPAAATPRPAEPVRSDARSQHRDNNRDTDPQFSMKAGDAAIQPGMRPEHAAPGFEIAPHVAERAAQETLTTAKTASSASDRPTIASDDLTPARPEVPTAPMKDISVRIQSEQGENVDIRIVRRAGDLQIAVKSIDGDTTQGLRHGLSELSDRLNATGYHADTWHPGQAATTETTADSGNSQHSQQQSQGDSQSHSGWSQQNGGQRDDKHSNRPRWIEELESNISSPAETGQFNGLLR
jgi:hypothetical protein